MTLPYSGRVKKGARKERTIPKLYGFKNMREMNKNPNYIIARSAGSHSAVDVWVVCIKERKIDLYQCKPDNYTGKDFARYVILNGTMEVQFKLV